MALLGGDGFRSARGLLGRAIDVVREGAGSVRDFWSSTSHDTSPSTSKLPTPQWRQPISAVIKPAIRKLRRLVVYCWPGGPVTNAITAWFYRQPLVRFISRSLLHRILCSTLIGFAILFGGILYISLDSSWVINAKRDALKIQGQIIAAAIAGDPQISTTDFTLDPDTIPGKEAAHVPLRDDEFAAMELSLQPQRVAPILNRLIEPIKTRARIYDKKGHLVVDSSMLLKTGDVTDNTGKVKANRERPTTKNFWTRLQHWLIGKEFQVYKEIGTANGRFYPEVREALEGNPEAMLLLNTKGEQIVSMAVPIQRFGRVLGVLLLSTAPGEVDDILANEREAIWPLAALALLAGIVTSLLMARTVGGPMKRLSAAAELVSKDINAHADLPSYPDRTDEVGQMAKAFRSMTAALFRRIAASEKFAADVAHELKNPLTAASSTAQALEYAKTDEQREQLVQQIQNELKRLNRLITDVSSASRLDAELARQSSDPVAMDQVLRNIVAIFEDKAAGRGCDFLLQLPPNTTGTKFTVSGNEGRLAQVFTNLVDNALSFTPDDSTVRIRARRDDQFVVIIIEDEGPGIQSDKLATIFDRFYTYRPTEFSSRGDNSGLGLSISHEIVVAHGGTIWAENRLRPNDATPRGARFITRLPARLDTLNRADAQGGQGAKRA